MIQVRVSILSITALLLAAPAAPASAATLDPTTVAEAIEAAAKANLPDTVVRVDARSVKVFGDLEVPTDADLRVLGGGNGSAVFAWRSRCLPAARSWGRCPRP